MRSAFLTLVPLLLVLGCSALTGPEAPAVRIEVEEERFARDPITGAATISFSVRNTGNSTLYLDRCSERLSTLVDRWENGHWVHFKSDGCPAVYEGHPLPLEVGEERGSVRMIHEPGRYRLRLGISEVRGARSRWTAASPGFTVD